MKPRLLKTKIGQYVPATSDGVNRARIRVYGAHVLVLPDKADEKIGSIFLANDTKETHSLAATTGVVIALGRTAFMWDSSGTKTLSDERPKPGDRIIYDRYAGQRHWGLDGVEYRVMSDTAIAGAYIDLDEAEGTENTNG